MNLSRTTACRPTTAIVGEPAGGALDPREERALLRLHRSMRVQRTMSARWFRLRDSALDAHRAAVVSARIEVEVDEHHRILRDDPEVRGIQERLGSDPESVTPDELDRLRAAAAKAWSDAVWSRLDMPPRAGWAEELYEAAKGDVPW